MPVSGHPIPRPQGQRPDTMGCAVEASPKRLRHHLRRPDADEGQLIMKPPLTPLIGQTLTGRPHPISAWNGRRDTGECLTECDYRETQAWLEVDDHARISPCRRSTPVK